MKDTKEYNLFLDDQRVPHEAADYYTPTRDRHIFRVNDWVISQKL